MAWATSDRRGRLPRDWVQRRQEVFRIHSRQCYIAEGGRRCTAEATEVDHVNAGDDHSYENLRPICHQHHKSKSSSEGWRAMNRKKKAARSRAEKKYGWAEKRPEPEAPFVHPWMR